jgi:metal-responsive CopG/Arc/MetJ family transcriptional regulator
MKTTEAIECRFKMTDLQKLEDRAKQLSTTRNEIVRAAVRDYFRSLEEPGIVEV